MKTASASAPTAPLLLSIFLTVCTPLSALAEMRCSDVFNGSAELIERTGRYANLERPLTSPQFSRPARLVLTRFGAHETFQTASTHQWIFDGQTFRPESAGLTIRHGFSHDESILADQQDFSLGKMVESGYLSAAQARMFRRDGSTRNETGQVNVFEMQHEATRDEIAAFYRDYPDTRVGIHQNYDDPELRSIKTAALFSVGGQVWDQQSGVRNVKLPWEREDSRKDQALDRKKYKFVWEWGRAAQDANGEIAPLYAANALLNYIQLKGFGGKLDDAYIVAHSFDKLNSRLYSRMHPNSLYPAGWKDMNDALFLAPLKEALEKYRPSSVSKKVADLVRLSGGKMSDLHAVDFLIAARTYRWHEFDVAFPNATSTRPIILNDSSQIHAQSLWAWLAPFEMPREMRQRIFEYAIQDSTLLHTANYKGKYEYAADSLLTQFHYHEANAVEISNLDPALAARDQKYVPSVLISAYWAKVTELALMINHSHHLPWEESFASAAKAMVDLEVSFGVTTSEPVIEKQLKTFSPIKVAQQPGTMTASPLASDAPERLAKPYAYRDARMYFYSARQLQHWINVNPEFHRAYGKILRTGVWTNHYLQSQTDLF